MTNGMKKVLYVVLAFGLAYVLYVRTQAILRNPMEWFTELVTALAVAVLYMAILLAVIVYSSRKPPAS
jgi:hypothetical protein